MGSIVGTIINTNATNTNMNEIIEYIKSFLLYGNNDAAKLIGYTSNSEKWKDYQVIIIPSQWDLHYPDFDKKIEIRQEGKIKIIEEDIIYNTFFLISRAEELLNDQRDEHGRFLAKHSILNKENQLLMPIVDEYSDLVIKLLGLNPVKSGYSKINLTHDVDTIAHFRHFRGFLGGIKRGQIATALQALEDISNDPAYTFPWLIAQDNKLSARIGCQTEISSIYFLKDGPNIGYDYPQYHGKDVERLTQLLLSYHCQLGYHSSYNSSTHKSPDDLVYPSTLHRSHFLRCSIDTLQEINDLGYTDDYTIGFPDKAGFRLGTTRAVRWINPKTMQLTDMVLHPLIVMDCTLSNDNYMNLNEEEAFYYCQELFEKVRQHNGELTLLWHNSIINEQTYHKSLYKALLESIEA